MMNPKKLYCKYNQHKRKDGYIAITFFARYTTLYIHLD